MKALQGQLSATPYILTSKLSLPGFWQTDVGMNAARVCVTDANWVQRTEVLIERPPIARCAWPKEVLDDPVDPAGYTFTNHWQSAQPLSDLNQPGALVSLSWLHLHRLAYDLCQVVADLHTAGYVLSGLDPEHIWLDVEGTIAIANLDGLQFVDGQSLYLGCEGALVLTPPELVAKTPWIQTTTHDNFRLATLIYQILLGTHPYIGTATDIDLATRLQEGLWLGNPRSRLKVPPTALPQSCLNHELQELFQRCFEATEPQQRPSCREWRNGLARAIRALQQCEAQPSHYYSAELDSCPWCNEFKTLGTDRFAKSQLARPGYCNNIHPDPDQIPLQAKLLTPDVMPTAHHTSGAIFKVLAITSIVALFGVFIYHQWRQTQRQVAVVPGPEPTPVSTAAPTPEPTPTPVPTVAPTPAFTPLIDGIGGNNNVAALPPGNILTASILDASRIREGIIVLDKGQNDDIQVGDIGEVIVSAVISNGAILETSQTYRINIVEVDSSRSLAQIEIYEGIPAVISSARILLSPILPSVAPTLSELPTPEPLIAASMADDMAFIVGNIGGVLIRTAIPRNALPNQGVVRITSPNGFGITLTDSNPGVFMYEQLLPPGQYNVQLERPGFCPYNFSFSKVDDIGVYNSSTGSAGIGIIMNEGC